MGLCALAHLSSFSSASSLVKISFFLTYRLIAFWKVSTIMRSSRFWNKNLSFRLFLLFSLSRPTAPQYSVIILLYFLFLILIFAVAGGHEVVIYFFYCWSVFVEYVLKHTYVFKCQQQQIPSGFCVEFFCLISRCFSVSV